LTHYTVAYHEWGQGPPLVLVPGLAGGFGLLGPLAKLLARNFRVISYQLRGEDDCFTLRRHFELRDLVDDLKEFIDWHGLESPVLMGVSFGGVLALEYAARFPHRLERLVVQGTGARLQPGLLQRVASAVLSRYPLPNDNPFINQFFNLLFGCRPKQDPLFDFVTQQCWRTDQSVMAHRFRLVEQFNIARHALRIRVPALIMTGDRDVLVSKQSAGELGRAIAASRQVTMKGCGHLAFVTQPQRVAEEVREFLAEYAV
jgi:pimeloyl-ACP methyl ester carboxylesterase